MTHDNLPPGVTPADIDKHFAPPIMDKIMGEVTVVLDEEIPEHYDRQEAVRALMAKVSDALDDASIEPVNAEVQERWQKMDQ